MGQVRARWRPSSLMRLAVLLLTLIDVIRSEEYVVPLGKLFEVTLSGKVVEPEVLPRWLQYDSSSSDSGLLFGVPRDLDDLETVKVVLDNGAAMTITVQEEVGNPCKEEKTQFFEFSYPANDTSPFELRNILRRTAAVLDAEDETKLRLFSTSYLSNYTRETRYMRQGDASEGAPQKGLVVLYQSGCGGALGEEKGEIIANLPDAYLDTLQVGSREQCLSACLKEREFVCRSVNYNYDSYLCEMSTEDRRSKPSHMRMSDLPVDYYDNNCLSRQNRCGQTGGNLVFVKTTQFEIHYYDHTQSVEAQESYCLQKCLDSLNTFCRSVEFSPQEKNCIVSDEDTFSRADQQGAVQSKDYYEPICVAADLSSSTCRQQAAFERFIGTSIEGQPVASAQSVTVSDCISLCFQNLNCKSINYDRTQMTCYIYSVGRSEANVKTNPSFDFYEFNCESQFGGMALCTNEGIRFIVNTKEPYTGAIYAAEKFSTCSQVVENAKQISITFPPPTASTNCGTYIKDGKVHALVVVSLDGVLPHQVTTEWDRFYHVTCDAGMSSMTQEGSVVVTTIFETGEANTQVLDVGTPPPITAVLSFLDASDQPLGKASIGDSIQLVVTSEQAGPHNMMITECTATRVGGEGDAVPFTIIDNGCPRYPALVGPIEQDFDKNRLKSDMKAFRLDGSYDVQIQCTIMFCAGPNGCPPSNCLDSGTNELFVSHGRKKRSVQPASEDQTAETLSAIIRVLAEGEQDEEADLLHKNSTLSGHTRRTTFVDEDDLVCMSDAWFVSMVVSMSLVCLMLSGLIVVWGCHSLRADPKLPL